MQAITVIPMQGGSARLDEVAGPHRAHRRRAVWRPRVVLVVGAGPIGLLAALLAVQRGLEVHMLDRVTTGPKPALVADLGPATTPGR